MKHRFLRLALLITFPVCAVGSTPLHACPLTEGLIDFNCNQKLRVVFTGDSVVAGLGDAENSHRGGYVKRMNQRLPRPVQVKNLGFSGIRSDQLLRRFLDGLYRRQVQRADVVFIDVGKNDCRDNLPPIRAVRNIKRLVRFFQQRAGNETLGNPYVVIATQIPNRDRRRACIEEINRLLLVKKSEKLPAYFRFDKLPASILGSDGLHPNSAGYARMSRRIYRFFTNALQNRLASERPDQDVDGIYDYFEELRYGTSPSLADSDGDTLSDGDETFVYGTDPLEVDTDGDGRDDNVELDSDTDPLVVD